ncbi:MAG: alpha/beta hydrolase, partial [Candidatus Obscuribacterales bacterium]|nr:alpha/beta hydrolase [Candidatus Obscuribacterales bacterium]
MIITILLIAMLPFVTKEPDPSLQTGIRIIRDLPYVPGSVDENQTLDLFIPKTKFGTSLPLIIWIHGGGWIEGDKSSSPSLELARKGFATASINYRLAPKNLFPAQIYDCKAAIRFIRAHAEEYNIDPDRIGVWGHSAGGHLAALLGTTNDIKELEGDLGNLDRSSATSAVCDWCGPTNLLTFKEQCPPDVSMGDISPPELVDM